MVVVTFFLNTALCSRNRSAVLASMYIHTQQRRQLRVHGPLFFFNATISVSTNKLPLILVSINTDSRVENAR